MKETIIQPLQSEESVIIQFSAPTIVNKKTKVTVPNQYKALAYIDEKMLFRIDPCSEKVIYIHYGKEYIGKKLQLAFVLTKEVPQLAWGFGNIPVNNERLKEAYRVGANGKYKVELIDAVRLIQAYELKDSVTPDKIREKTISIIKTVGIPILSSCFANTNVSVFEINSLLGEIREKMLDSLQKESVINKLGIRVTSLIIDGIHVNEEDLQIIRNRINE